MTELVVVVVVVVEVSMPDAEEQSVKAVICDAVVVVAVDPAATFDSSTAAAVK